MIERNFFPGDIVKDKETGRLGVVFSTIEFEPNKFQADRIQVSVSVHQTDSLEVTFPRRRFKRLMVVREARTEESRPYHPGRLIRNFTKEFKPC